MDCYTPAKNWLLAGADWVTASCTSPRRRRILPLAAVAIVVVALTNYLIGPAAWFGPFYIMIICLVTWSNGAGYGIIAGVSCMTMGLLLNGLDVYSSSRFALGWMIGTRMTTVLLIIALVALFRRSYLREWTRARTDYLTGALTKGAYFEERAGHTSKNQWRVLAYLDLDKFKDVNDRHGHAEGDAVLRLFARTLLNSIRHEDALVRLGGDEFLIDLWARDETSGRAALTSIYQRLDRILHSEGHKLGCSVGGLLLPPRSRAVEESDISAADHLMYRAKRDRLREPLFAMHEIVETERPSADRLVQQAA